MPNKTAIIVPCYNEELRLPKEQFINFVSLYDEIDLWFIDDGSTDNTLDVITNLSKRSPVNIHVHALAVNSGKAEAVRRAFVLLSDREEYTFIGFIDADLSAPLVEILPLLAVMENREILLAAGTRVKLVGKIIERNIMRYYLSRIFTTYYDNLLRLPNYDTQCGLKLFEREITAKIFAEPFVSKWLFDVEIFLRIQHIVGRKNYSRCIREIPLNEWKEIGGSKVKLLDFIKAPIEILRIYRKYKAIIRL